MCLESTLLGPLISETAVKSYLDAVDQAKKSGGKVEYGGNRIDGTGYFVEPTIVSGLKHNDPLVLKETFAPIVYVTKFKVCWQFVFGQSVY